MASEKIARYIADSSYFSGYSRLRIALCGRSGCSPYTPLTFPLWRRFVPMTGLLHAAQIIFSSAHRDQFPVPSFFPEQEKCTAKLSRCGDAVSPTLVCFRQSCLPLSINIMNNGSQPLLFPTTEKL